MKIAGGLTIILIFGALESLQALNIPLGNQTFGAGASFDKDNGLTLSQSDTHRSESHKNELSKGSSHVEDADRTEKDSEYSRRHEENKEDETTNSRSLSIGQGGLNFVSEKESSGSSQQIDENSNKTHEKNEETAEGYSHKKEIEKNENNLREENKSYKKKEKSGFGLGQDGFKKSKTVKSEETKESIKNAHSNSLKEVDEESIKDGDKTKHKKSISNVNNASEGTQTVETASRSETGGDASESKEDSNDYSLHYSAFGEEFNSSVVDGVKSSSSSGFVQEDSKVYSHVGGDSWTKTGVKEVDDLFTDLDKGDGSIFGFGGKRRRKRNTVQSSQNFEFGHHQEINHNSYGSQRQLINNNEHENRQSLGIQRGNQNGFRNVQSRGPNNFEHNQASIGNYRSGGNKQYSAKFGNSNRLSVNNGINGNRRIGNGNNNGYTFRNNHVSINSNYRSGNANNFVSSRNGNNGIGRQFNRGNLLKYNSGKGQPLIRYGNSNQGSSRGSGLRDQTTGPAFTLRNSNINFRNGARNNLYGGRGGYKLGNGFSNDNLGKRVNNNLGLQNGGHVKPQYRKGVKHEDVLNFLTNNGRRLSNQHHSFNTGHHIGIGFRPSSNHYYPRRNSGYKQGNSNFGSNLGVDVHHFANNIHYSTGNGRYVFIPGQNGAQHRFFDTITGLHFSGHKITLHNGNHVIVPGSYVGNAGNGNLGVGVGIGNQGIDLGFGISYLGGGKYLHQGQIIPAVNIAAYLKSLGITGIQLNANGLPSGLVGQFPLDLGFGISYQGDGTYKYKNTIIPSDKITAFCKSKNIDGISFTNDGFPAVLLDGSLGSTVNSNLTLPINLGNDLEYIGNNHYQWNDQIIPAVQIGDFIKDHGWNINVTTEGLPVNLFNATIGGNVVNNTTDSVASHVDDHLNPNGIFPYTVGPNIVYDGKGNYIHNNLTIPSSNIIEYCKANNLANISFTPQGLPASLFGDDQDTGLDFKYPVYLSEDLSYLGGGHYKYKDQIILASDIGDFIKEHNLNVHVTKEGLPLALFVEALDDIVVDANGGQGTYENDGLFYQDHYPLDLGSNLTYFINGSYGYNNQIISPNDIIEFCKSKSINNISFVEDGYPAILFNNTDDGSAGSDIKFPINVGDDLLYYNSGLYRHINKTIPIVDVLDYVQQNKLNGSLTDDGLPTQLVDVNLGSGSGNNQDGLVGVQNNAPVDFNGDFPYDLGSNILYLGNGSYKVNDDIIPNTDIISYSKSHNINDVAFTDDGFPAALFNISLSHEGSNDDLPIDIGKGLYYLGYSHYEYENKIYPAANVSDIVKDLGLNITINDDGVPLELLDEQEYSSGNVSIDLGHGFIYDHKNFIYNNETIPADKIVDFCKGLNLTVTFSDGYPELYDNNDVQTSQQASDCPKGPVDLGEGLIYVGDCNYMYQDHVIPSKYILGLLDILHIQDIALPVGPDDNYSSTGGSNNSDSSGNNLVDLGFGVYYLGNDTYQYKNRYIPKASYADFLNILGLKVQSDGSDQLVQDGSKSDKSDDEILGLVDKLLSNNNANSTDGSNNSTDSSTADGSSTRVTVDKNVTNNDGSANQQTTIQVGSNDGSNNSTSGSAVNVTLSSSGSSNSSTTNSSDSNSTTTGSSNDTSSSTNITSSNTTTSISSTNSTNTDVTKTSSSNSTVIASNSNSNASNSSNDSTSTDNGDITNASKTNSTDAANSTNSNDSTNAPNSSTDSTSTDSSDVTNASLSNSTDNATNSASNSSDSTKTQDSNVNNSTVNSSDSNGSSADSTTTSAPLSNDASQPQDGSSVNSSTTDATGAQNDASNSSDVISGNSATTDSSNVDANKVQNTTAPGDSAADVANTKDVSSSSDDSKTSNSTTVA